MFTIQPRRRSERDEELRSVCVWATFDEHGGAYLLAMERIPAPVCLSAGESSSSNLSLTHKQYKIPIDARATSSRSSWITSLNRKVLFQISLERRNTGITL